MLKKSPPESHICVYARDIAVKARIGLYDDEKEPQKLLVSIALYAAPFYLSEITEEKIIDYKILYDAVMEWPQRPHVRLIETYLRELLAIAFDIPQVAAARISITKADIFPEAQGGAGVEVFVTREDYEASVR